MDDSVVEVEIRKNGKRIFYVEFVGDPNNEGWVENYKSATTRVWPGSERILQEATFYAGLVEGGK